MTTPNPKGGKRPGAGRPKGSKNRRLPLVDQAIQEGEQPLPYLLAVMRDEKQDQAVRFEAAKAAAPYCHARLTATHVTEGEGVKTHAQWLEEIRDELEADEEDESAKSVH